MARTQSRYYPNDEIFRAKIEFLNADGTERENQEDWTAYYGPYSTSATAKGVASNKLRYRTATTPRVTIQKAVTVWEDVE